MKQFAIIGLGSFGIRMAERLSEVSDEVIILDKDSLVIEKYKDLVKSAYITDAMNEEAIKRIIPATVDAVIVDLGGKIEASILVTNYLKKMGIQNIIVKAGTDEQGEVLKLVGASLVVFPDIEAARRIVPMLVSPLLFNYMPISESLVIAEVKVPAQYEGMSLIQANFRQKYGINVIALRKNGTSEYIFFKPDYLLQFEDMLLVAGKEKDVIDFSGKEEKSKRKKNIDIFKDLLSSKK